MNAARISATSEVAPAFSASKIHQAAADSSAGRVIKVSVCQRSLSQADIRRDWEGRDASSRLWARIPGPRAVLAKFPGEIKDPGPNQNPLRGEASPFTCSKHVYSGSSSFTGKIELGDNYGSAATVNVAHAEGRLWGHN